MLSRQSRIICTFSLKSDSSLVLFYSDCISHKFLLEETSACLCLEIVKALFTLEYKTRIQGLDSVYWIEAKLHLDVAS